MPNRAKPAHAAPQGITLYRPELVTFARHRKPNRRPLMWHVDTLASATVLHLAERAMKGRH